jgi:formylglycine-generating enzyme required for sulfatase activity
MEWGLLANISLKNGTLPHGNTNSGSYHADGTEKGENYDGGYGKTLTGSGPATWTHNHTPEGVHDLCGNVWEMLRGLRLMTGELQVIKDNDAASTSTHTRKPALAAVMSTRTRCEFRSATASRHHGRRATTTTEPAGRTSIRL